MDLDSYLSPGAERLLRSAQDRRDESGSGRALRAELSAAAVFLVWAAALAITAHWDRPLSAASLVVCGAVLIVARRITFPVGSATTSPTQIAFVPMLFVLPTPVVPLVVGGCAVLSMWPELVSGRMAAAAVRRLPGRLPVRRRARDDPRAGRRSAFRLGPLARAGAGPRRPVHP